MLSHTAETTVKSITGQNYNCKIIYFILGVNKNN